MTCECIIFKFCNKVCAYFISLTVGNIVVIIAIIGADVIVIISLSQYNI